MSANQSSDSRPPHPLRIAIIGGGYGGLTLARVLQKQGIRATVFEQYTSVSDCPPGDSHMLEGETGLKAIRETGLFDEYLKCAKFEGHQIRLLDKSGVVHADFVENNEGKGEIGSTDLHRVLLDSLDEGTVQWGCKLTTITPLTDEPNNSQHKLMFENSREETADFIVGADGAWSTIRPLLSPVKPSYGGVCFIGLTISAVESRYPSMSAIPGKGIMGVFADNKGIFAGRQDSLMKVIVGLRVADKWLDDFEGTILPRVRVDAIISLFHGQGWASELLDFIRFADADSIILHKPHSLLIPYPWSYQPGLTLLGDAAHITSSLDESGIDLAMIDALDLGLALSDICKAAAVGLATNDQIAELMEVEVRRYELTMYKRGAQMIREQMYIQDKMYSEEGLTPFLDQIADFEAGKG